MKNQHVPSKIFTAAEKRRDLVRCSFRRLELDGVDLSGANLGEATFEEVSLRGCDLRKADLRGAVFLRCDLRGALLDGTFLGGNRFHGSCFAGATGLSEEQTAYVARHGGSLAEWTPEEGAHLRLLK
jgi:uncharacterized protein YjbI with pentapeptide repeats